MTSNRTIIIYRDELLGASETFVLAQAESLSRFQPFYLGLRHRKGLDLPESRVHIVGGDGLVGKWRRAQFRLLGPNPSLRSRLAAMHPALIHAHFGPDGCNAIALARALHVPLIVTLHGYDINVADTLLPRLYIERRDLLKSHAARFICISEFLRKQAIAKGFPADKTVVHYTGIDLNTFHVRPIVARSPIVLFVGRLVPVKGCEYLIRAMARVQQVMPEVGLVVIGDGPLREPLVAQAASALKNCLFLGEQKQGAVRDWMNRAAVFSVPSTVAEAGDTEGFGMVFAEAQAMGLPIVSFASGGIPEVVADEQSGFLVAERDDAALVAKLLLLLGNRDLWTKMSKSGQAHVKRLFDIRTQATILENIYDTVLTEWGRKPNAQKPDRPADSSVQHPDMAMEAAQISELASPSAQPRSI